MANVKLEGGLEAAPLFAVDTAAVSAALSVKRIADVAERIAKALDELAEVAKLYGR